VDLYDEGHLHYWTFRSLETMLRRYCGFMDTRRVPYSPDEWIPSWLAPWLARYWPEAFSDVAVIAYK
jgi:hypothetical protein